MINIIDFIDNGNELISYNYNNISKIFYNIDEIPKYKQLNLKLNNKRWWITTNFGKILQHFKYIDKEQIGNLLTQIYMIDSLHSIISLKNYGYTFAQYNDNKIPFMQVKGLSHPCLTNCTNDTVKNSINLGNEKSYNMILTGPNAGGKSTLVKSILINTLLCQTITMSCSNECNITPFKYINSQINIPDCKGKESLFQAEMNRCKNNFDIINSLEDNDHSLIIMDEVFNSTNPIEGISGAYAVASHLSKNTNVMVIFTTHFVYLTKLQKNTNRFTNYRMNIKKRDNKIIFPYKLKKGISQQYIALDLLEQNGFNKDLIIEAKKIRDKLTI
jgi:DNA mismatch repair protein MutS